MGIGYRFVPDVVGIYSLWISKSLSHIPADKKMRLTSKIIALLSTNFLLFFLMLSIVICMNILFVIISTVIVIISTVFSLLFSYSIHCHLHDDFMFVLS
jgi:hypothetical protein